MSSTATSASASAFDTSIPTNGLPSGGGGGGTQTSLYLYTFLITIIVLAVIAAGFITRSNIIRRRHRRRIDEAIRNGRPPPSDAAAALGFARVRLNRKKEIDHGPMPSMWEAEMRKDDGSSRRSSLATLQEKNNGDSDVTYKEVSFDEQDEWEDMTPLAMLHVSEATPDPAQGALQNFNYDLYNSSVSRRQMLRSIFRPSENTDSSAHLLPEQRPGYVAPNEISELVPSFETPVLGSEVVVGVLIALPAESVNDADGRSLGSGEMDQQVPDICLGVMDVKVSD